MGTLKRDLFGISPTSIAPSLKYEADDGEFGYAIRLEHQGRRLELELNPSFWDFEQSSVEKSIEEIQFDVDFYTMKPVRMASLSVERWLSRWFRALHRDGEFVLTSMVRS